MRLEVRLYATLRQAAPDAPAGVLPVEMPDGAAVADVLAAVKIDPAKVHLIMVNGVAADLGRVLSDGDRLGLFPPVGGG
jgi:molybdopterin converting factor small subunit